MASDDNPKARPMTGFWAHLTPEQKAKALAYRGPENHGDPAFLRRRRVSKLLAFVNAVHKKTLTSLGRK